VLELAILGLLKEQELHGYELKKRLAETLGVASGVSFGSLYPALGRLEAAGAVKAVEALEEPAPPAIPMTGSLGGELAAFRARRGSSRSAGRRSGRARKVYGITERGERLFAELLIADSQSSDDDRVFNLKLAFARYLPPDARLGLLERRRAHLLDRLARARTSFRGDRERLDGYTRSVIEHGSETTERDISWLDRLIATERAGSAREGTAREGPAESPITSPRTEDSTAQPTNPGQTNREATAP
jgi:DNA-binding PadR family transcriptional regulator